MTQDSSAPQAPLQQAPADSSGAAGLKECLQKQPKSYSLAASPSSDQGRLAPGHCRCSMDGVSWRTNLLVEPQDQRHHKGQKLSMPHPKGGRGPECAPHQRGAEGLSMPHYTQHQQAFDSSWSCETQELPCPEGTSCSRASGRSGDSSGSGGSSHSSSCCGSTAEHSQCLWMSSEGLGLLGFMAPVGHSSSTAKAPQEPFSQVHFSPPSKTKINLRVRAGVNLQHIWADTKTTSSTCSQARLIVPAQSRFCSGTAGPGTQTTIQQHKIISQKPFPKGEKRLRSVMG